MPTSKGYEMVPQYGAILPKEEGIIETDPSIQDGEESTTTIIEDAKCTVFETTCNLITVITGSGMLSLPYAAAVMGWSGVLLLIILGVMFMYSYRLLAQSIEGYKALHPDYNHQQYFIDYVTLGKYTFGRGGDTMVLVVFATELQLALMSFYMNIAINLLVLFPTLSYKVAIFITLCITFALSSVELKLAAYSSALGSFLTIFTILALFWSGHEMIGNNNHVANDYPTHYNGLHAAGTSMAAGLIAFCFGGHSTFPKLYSVMREPGAYQQVITTTGLVVCAVYALLMAMGYAIYAQYTLAPITLNIGRQLDGAALPHGRGLQMLAAVGVVANLLVTCPLVTLPVRDVLLKIFQLPSTFSYRNSITAGLVSLAAALALQSQGHFASACSLIGALTTFADSIILPVLFYHAIFPLASRSLPVVALHGFIFSVAIVAFSSGILQSLCLEFKADLPTAFCASH